MKIKKIFDLAPLLSIIVIVGCMAITVVNYNVPTFKIEARAKNNDSSGETGTSPVAGSFDLADGLYQGVGNGFAGKITVSVEIKDKSIIAINILDVAGDDAAFFNRAKGVIDKIISSQSLDVDVVSGATFSSRGIISAVKNALTGEADTNTTENKGNSNTKVKTLSTVNETATYKDGTYYGTGTGFGGSLRVKVDIVGGKISAIEIVSHNDGDSYVQKASGLISAIIAGQTTNVDTVSGATYSSVGIIEAVRNALSQAQVTQTNVVTPTTQEAPTISGTIPYIDGVYYGTGEGYMGDITVAIVIEDKTLKAVLITQAMGEDEAYLNRAKTIIDKILKQQSVAVDTISGATFSSRGILSAVTNALNEAKKATDGNDEEIPGKPDEELPDNSSSIYKDGQYDAVVLCLPDEDEDFTEYNLSLKMTITNGKITAISDVIGSGENYLSSNDSYIKRALKGTSSIPGIESQILTKNSALEIDTVSRATCSSKAIIEACQKILDSAKK